jgi:hypothetical protein
LKRLVLLGLGLALFVAALVVGWNFGAANATTLDIDLLWLKVAEITVWQLTLASFGLGAGSVLLLAGFLGTRGWLLRRRYRATIRRLESELHQLRSLPLSDAGSATDEGRATTARAAARGRA